MVASAPLRVSIRLTPTRRSPSVSECSEPSTRSTGPAARCAAMLAPNRCGSPASTPETTRRSGKRSRHSSIAAA